MYVLCCSDLVICLCLSAGLGDREGRYYHPWVFPISPRSTPAIHWSGGCICTGLWTTPVSSCQAP